VKKPEPFFFIVMGAVTAFGLPFAIAFPRTLLEKLLALLVLVLLAAAIATGATRLRNRP